VLCSDINAKALESTVIKINKIVTAGGGSAAGFVADVSKEVRRTFHSLTLFHGGVSVIANFQSSDPLFNAFAG
jgi:hypothetical protein